MINELRGWDRAYVRVCVCSEFHIVLSSVFGICAERESHSFGDFNIVSNY